MKKPGQRESGSVHREESILQMERDKQTKINKQIKRKKQKKHRGEVLTYYVYELLGEFVWKHL